MSCYSFSCYLKMRNIFYYLPPIPFLPFIIFYTQCWVFGECSLNKCIILNYCLLHSDSRHLSLHLSLPEVPRPSLVTHPQIWEIQSLKEASDGKFHRYTFCCRSPLSAPPPTTNCSSPDKPEKREGKRENSSEFSWCVWKCNIPNTIKP